ncbi:hypothetical protein D0Z07_1860 [Hyphodiscus hymeniophilus]|uniref:AlteRNAtive oxidase protein n=1 Tax=Hyphodiscus hymeniophilus TaxID=353542 RepID=A0A9P6VPI3_9HELO|nr:hypothetical protein D0Z07_1860 [Hyphodiscus hymeniophilus]
MKVGHTHYPSPTSNAAIPVATSETKVADVKTHTKDKFDGLRNLCDEIQWTDGLWLHCHNHCGENQTSICGGLNNARSRIQTCLRYAIDAGMGIILPSVTMRNEDELLQTDGGTSVCPEKFWDITHLQKAMRKQCPQLQIRTCGDRSGFDIVLDAPSRNYMDTPYTNGTFRAFMEDVLEVSGLNFADATRSNPILITFADTYVGWNYRYSLEITTIRKALFKVLQFNKQLLKLSSKVLQSPELQEGAFIGVHLRGESDWPAGFGGLNDQMRLYVEEIEKIQTSSPTEVKTVYVSCGDSIAIGLFRDMLSPLGYTVHDKWTLLAGQPDILAQVEGLTFDEKAIVEYQTLVQAKFWMGIITSSMSSLIAYARSVNDKEDFFDTYVFPGSERSGFNRAYPESPSMKGNNVTKLMVLSGPDIMESFP